LCLDSWWMLSLPRPLLPPVTMMTFPDRSGMSFSGLKRVLYMAMIEEADDWVL
jgi:hypothetical protein